MSSSQSQRARVESVDLSPQADFTCLPIELVIEILSWLPPETVGLCRTLCKQFYNLTKDPQFVDLHLLRSKSQSPRILLRPSSCVFDRNHYWACFEEGSFKQIPPSDIFGEDIYAHASCNGVLCMSKYCDIDIEPVVLINPITRESAEIPKSKFIPLENDENSYHAHVGFSYDLVHEKYKVVRLYAKYSMGEEEDDEWYEMFAEIITLGESSWRVLVMPSGIMDVCQQIFHNGAFYWASSLMYEEDEHEQETILVFDISNEVFHTIDVSLFPESPFSEEDMLWSNLRLTIFGEFLCLVERSPRAPSNHRRMWKITGNQTNGYRLCRQTLEIPDEMQKPGRVLQFWNALSDKSYLFTGEESYEGDGGLKSSGVVALLNQPKNEISSAEVQYAVGEMVMFYIRLVEPSLISPSTLISGQDHEV